MRKAAALSLVITGAAALAQAPAPGTAQGALHVNGASIPLLKAYAHLHDNAEGVLDSPKELRIMLADKAQPDSALGGLNLPFTAVDRVKDGAVRGLMIRLDPANLNAAVITLLYPPAHEGMSLVNQTVSNSGKPALKKLVIKEDRVEGEIEAQAEEHDDPDFPSASYAIRFSAILTREPAVTATLKGKAAQDSPQMQLLRLKARALAKGDLKGVGQYMTEDSFRRQNAEMAQAGAQAVAFVKQQGAEMEKSLKDIDRIVVRGDHASAIWKDKNWMTLVKVGDAWKTE